MPAINISNLGEQGAQQKSKTKSKQERMKEVREMKKDKFEEMRLRARNTVKGIPD